MTTLALEVLLNLQDHLVTRRQALELMTADQLASRLGPRWQIVLPGVYAAFTGALSPRQRLRAGILAAGEQAVLTDLDALSGYRIPYLPPDPFVRVLVPDTVHRTSRQFVVVRRTVRMPSAVIVDGLPTAPAARALAEFVARHADQREALAVAAATIQRGRASVQQLAEEARLGPARGRPRLLRVIDALSCGVRSAPEDDFRRLVSGSKVLPEPLWNPYVTLASGRRLSPDALLVDSAVIHETNGRDVHSALSDFDDMQRRHDELTAAGFTVLHNSPRRIRENSAAVLAEIEQCHLRFQGRGLPAGVTLSVPSNAPLRGKTA